MCGKSLSLCPPIQSGCFIDRTFPNFHSNLGKKSFPCFQTRTEWLDVSFHQWEIENVQCQLFAMSVEQKNDLLLLYDLLRRLVRFSKGRMWFVLDYSLSMYSSERSSRILCVDHQSPLGLFSGEKRSLFSTHHRKNDHCKRERHTHKA